MDESRESDFNVRNEVVSSLDWCASFVMGQADKAGDKSFQEAIRDVGRKISDMSQGVKNAFQELVLTRAGNGDAIRSE